MSDNETVTDAFISHAHALIKIEAEAVLGLCHAIDDAFVKACSQLIDCKGKIIVTGLGKSGHIGRKIAATLASTGSPAFFMHATEALHGDLGMIGPEDHVIALSYSGESQELLQLMPALAQRCIPVIAMTGNPRSSLAQAATLHLNTHVRREACPLDLAPTASTTATLVMGDALAICLLRARGFSTQDFARSHPQGRLGRRLTLRAKDLMSTDQAIPQVRLDDDIKEVILEMTSKHLGMTTVVDAQGVVHGIITDGDLRRHWGNPNMATTSQTPATAQNLMTTQFKVMSEDTLAMQALETMQAHKITHLLILNPDRVCRGVLHIHHLLQANLL